LPRAVPPPKPSSYRQTFGQDGGFQARKITPPPGPRVGLNATLEARKITPAPTPLLPQLFITINAKSNTDPKGSITVNHAIPLYHFCSKIILIQRDEPIWAPPPSGPIQDDTIAGGAAMLVTFGRMLGLPDDSQAPIQPIKKVYVYSYYQTSDYGQREEEQIFSYDETERVFIGSKISGFSQHHDARALARQLCGRTASQ
jgi:hypothetical protein